MRQTLQEYTIEYGNSVYDSEIAIKDVLNYAKLTNRAPRLGDFVPTDEDDNVLEEPKYWKEHLSGLIAMADTGIHLEKCKQYQTAKDRVIFKGEWEVVKGSNSNHTRIYCEQLHTTIDFELSGVSLIRTDRSGFVLQRGAIDRIEDLPREIEFKEGVI
jgi:hypothetical protein